MQTLLDFFTNFEPGSWLGITLRGVFVYLFILWVAIVIWVARDSVARSKNLIFQVGAIALAIALNIFGLLIYLIIRPQKTLTESFQQELEQKILSEREDDCQKCGRPLPLEFQFCPGCGEEARHHCRKCHKLITKTWEVCPYCGIKKLEIKKEEVKK
jgi:RNA polymerase subunit RPABC4/transcription elongation factor Spt4